MYYIETKTSTNIYIYIKVPRCSVYILDWLKKNREIVGDSVVLLFYIETNKQKQKQREERGKEREQKLRKTSECMFFFYIFDKFTIHIFIIIISLYSLVISSSYADASILK